jgi:hypothetical protein
MQEHVLTGRITRLVTFKLQEFGARASFTIEDRGRSAVVCAVEGNVARDFIAGYCEGDSVMVRGMPEARPSTAATNTPWLGQFRVRAVRVAEDAWLAA